MPQTIVQTVVFKNAAAKDVYSLYMDEKKHSKATGAPAKISQKEGSPYSVHNGYITGKNLRLVKNKLIVQTWRAQDWDKNDSDSTFIISLQPKGKNVELQAIHANIPDKHVKGIDKGWHMHYWGPWKKFLAGKPILKSPSM
jgi:activator of HSP90 ATPase